ncbi:MAG: hypothetical protein PHH58_01865 [Rhodoferax sp.]|nr:hypothetical protein [Rhodoferax sp.]
MDNKPSYLGAFLKHPTNRVALLAAGVLGIFASIPLGWTGLLLVGVMALGIEILAALVVPSLPAFRSAVDLGQHQQARAQRRLMLLTDISNQGDTRALDTYQHMLSRVQALYQTANDKRTTLSRADVDKLEDLTVDYLGLCAVYLSLKQRKDIASEDSVAKRIASIQAQLQNTVLPEDEQRQLRNAMNEYTEVLQRSRRLATRRSAIEATLISLPDKMEEVYQLVMTSPYSSEMGSKLEESLARLRIAEEVASEFDAPQPVNFKPTQATRPVGTAFGRAARQAANTAKT